VSATIATAWVVVAAAVAGHLWAEARGWSAARAALKGLASAGFLAVAALRLAPDRYGLSVLAALVLSAIGDLCLLGRGRRAFVVGVGAFLLAHVAYAAAFAPRASPSAPIGAALAVAGALVLRWLWPHMGSLRIPVIAYALAISAMLWLALGVPSTVVRVGAVLFYLSDLTVARDRLVEERPVNRIVGIPIYYAAQLLLAGSVG
jgi:uncharacterized membrane protein YhhN